LQEDRPGQPLCRFDGYHFPGSAEPDTILPVVDANNPKKLTLRIHGRILEHLGISMYQSPVNAIAELVANAWDADADEVNIKLPTAKDRTFEITDTGVGMTFDECQSRFLNVGWNRRGKDPAARSPEKNRPILGRKGIGKFAGFGIANVMEVETVSKVTGERTKFKLNLKKLLSAEHVAKAEHLVEILDYEQPTKNRRRAAKNGWTKITLSDLNIKNMPNPERFAESMARRFRTYGSQVGFKILVNKKSIPDDLSLEDIQIVLPRDYDVDVQTERGVIHIDDRGWGTTRFSSGQEIRWRFMFHEKPISDEEILGVSVFANGKLAQAPFLFQLRGGLPGQHGLQYLTGQVEADFLDKFEQDVIATERQRINWEDERCAELLKWGQDELKKSIAYWQEYRIRRTREQLQSKIFKFSTRLDRLLSTERRTVERALEALARIPTLSESQFDELGGSILTAWEQGRVRDLIGKIADSTSLSEKSLLDLLVEAKVLTALSTAEAVRTKLEIVGGLYARIKNRELENAVRDFIAKYPWLISPQWETFQVEKTVSKLLDSMRTQAKLESNMFSGRVDLALASGSELLVLEFMQPGKSVDWDHIGRYELYVRLIRAELGNIRFGRVSGYLVADKIVKNREVQDKIMALRTENMYAMDWNMLFSSAISQWKDFMSEILDREPSDPRLKELADFLKE